MWNVIITPIFQKCHQLEFIDCREIDSDYLDAFEYQYRCSECNATVFDTYWDDIWSERKVIL